MKWTHALEDYSNFLKIEKGLALNSVNSYMRDVKKLIFFLENHKIIDSPKTISQEVVKQFMYETAQLNSSKTQARVLSGLRNFFNFLIFEGYRTENPTELIDSPKIARKLPDVLSINEIDLIISCIDLSKPQGERNRAIIETLYGCGLRVSELIELKLSDLFFEEGFIKVQGKGNKMRFVPINPQTQKFISIYQNAIRNHLTIKKGYEDILFLNRNGRKLTRVMIYTIVKNLVEKAGIKKNVSPHTFRHSFATHLLEHGANLIAIQQMLGHESITTTEIYTHLDKRYLKEVMDTFHPRK
ncbi:MAG: site-specific tyrosine recombinase XerD [Lutibacter sp.]